MNRICISGASSMIGIALIKECINQGIEVIALVRNTSINNVRIPKNDLVQQVSLSLENFSDENTIENNADIFIHLGWAYTNKEDRNSVNKQFRNIDYTLNAVVLAHKMGCKKFIGAGSQAEYGLRDSPSSANTPVNPLTAYGISKYAAGRLAQLKCMELGLDFNWIRIFSVYGKNDNEGTLLSSFINNCKKNIPMDLTSCEQVWDFLHEEDAGKAILAAALKGKPGKTYCLGSGLGKTLKEFLMTVVRICNPEYKPLFGVLPCSSLQPMFLVADISELTQDTGWKPEVSFEEGITFFNEGN